MGQHLPKLAGTDDPWVLLRATGQWQAPVGTARDTRRDIERAREIVADPAMISEAA